MNTTVKNLLQLRNLLNTMSDAELESITELCTTYTDDIEEGVDVAIVVDKGYAEFVGSADLV